MERLHSAPRSLLPMGLLSKALPRILVFWSMAAVAVAFAVAQGDEILLRRWLWAMLAASLIGVCGAVWWTAGVALQPVRSLTRRLQHIDGRRQPRLDLEGPAEISELTRSLSELLGQLHSSSVSREYLGSVLQAIPESLICVGPDGRIEDANRAAGRLLASSSDELRGTPIEEIFPIEPQAEYESLDDSGSGSYISSHSALREIELMGSLRRSRAVVRDVRGRSLDVEISGALLHDGDGTRRGMVLVAQPS